MNFEDKTFRPDEVEKIPREPGVYLFRGRRGEETKDSVLYVGKAKDLRSRVKQYFCGDGDGRAFSKLLQSRVTSIQAIFVGTEDDALLLENELIKKNKPAYNIMLKDDKRYLSIRLDTTHEWPRIEVVRKIRKDKATYLGPFSSSGRLRSTLDFMQKIFPLRTCDDRKLYNRSRPCIEYEIKRCVAPCVKYVTPDAYKKLVEAALLFLKGRSDELVQSLEAEMAHAVETESYELAARLRDQIQSIQTTQAGQSVIGLKQLQEGNTQDVIGFAREGRRTIVTLLFVRSGVILDKRTFEFMDSPLSPEDLLSEFVERYYSQEVFQPEEILISFEINPETDPRLIVPRSDEKKNFLKIANENARITLEASQQKSEKLEATLTGLQSALHLSQYPKAIDCMDISHHQGAETVASVVRFTDGKPDKSNYRKIKIKEDRVDDYASMKETIIRRYKSQEDLPNLLVIDGGRGQLSVAFEILKDIGWADNLDLVALAKARDQEGVDPRNPQNRERIFKVGQKNPILLKEDSATELLLKFLRDEAHRFAITYHRHRKDESMNFSALDSVKGISEKTKIKLFREFGSLEGMQRASDEELRRVVSARVLTALREVLNRAS